MTEAKEQSIGALEARLQASGLDLIRAFDASRYNQSVVDHERLSPLDLFGRERALGVVVGNSRALWARFMEALDRDVPLRQSADPLDEYTERALRGALHEMGISHHLYLAHEGGKRLVSMLHAAEVSGLAHRGPAHLAIHPLHGPWLALRALIVFDAPPLPESARSKAEAAPCAGCDAPCVVALEEAMREAGERPRAQGDIAPSWRHWVAVRDACPVGLESRYGENQIRYHYTKARDALR